MVGSGRARRSAPGTNCARSRLWFRKKLRTELPAARALSGVAVARLSSVSRNVQKILPRTYPGADERWRRCRPGGPALRKSCCADRADSQRCAHLANPRCEGCSGGGPGRRRNPRGALMKTYAPALIAPISAIGGKDREGHNVRSAGMDPVLTAFASISRASPAIGGITTVARSCPLRTHSWPVLVTPSQPVNGVLSHCSRSVSVRLVRAFL